MLYGACIKHPSIVMEAKLNDFSFTVIVFFWALLKKIARPVDYNTIKSDPFAGYTLLRIIKNKKI